MSAKEPPINVIGTEKAIQSMKRQIKVHLCFFAKGQGIIKITGTRSVEAYTICLPISSDRGAKTHGPTLKQITKVITDAKMMISSLTCQYFACPPMSPVTTPDPKATAKHMNPNKEVCNHFLALLLFLGFSLSP